MCVCVCVYVCEGACGRGGSADALYMFEVACGALKRVASSTQVKNAKAGRVG